VQTDADVRVEWLAGAAVVGLTAGTSTPDEVIDRVEARLRQIGDAVGMTTAAVAGSSR
jgi:4-hydroxy-3-methylbut-2-enyl diphosphate reductase IspH